MIDLHPVTLADKAWIDPLVWAEGSSSADYNFGNIFMWDHAFHQLVGRVNDRVIVMICAEGDPFFAWPVGKGDVYPVIEAMRAHAKEQGFPFLLRGVTAEHLPILDELYGRENYTAEPGRDYWDYLYTVDKLAELRGKKLHGKRNHIHRFEEQNDWRFEPMEARHFPACIELLDMWMASCGEDEQDGIFDEYAALQLAFRHFDDLRLDGGVLYSGDTLIAFTVGEPICEHTFDVHFEKAMSLIQGSYPMINREFVRYIREKYPNIQWINREDDTGRLSLRKSKESYYPDRMVEKYTVVFNDD